MTFNPDNYEVSIRSIDPTYDHTLSRDAGREDTSLEAHLASIDVTIQVRAKRAVDSDLRRTVKVGFAVDHDSETVDVVEAGDAHERVHGFRVGVYLLAVNVAGMVVVDYLSSVGLDYRPPEMPDVGDLPRPTVHLDMEVEK